MKLIWVLTYYKRSKRYNALNANLIISQVVFTLRFIYQWLYSEFKKVSALPLGFWLLSLVGSLLILIYAINRKDPVLFVGHLLGSIIYVRNLILLHKQDAESV